MQLFPRPPAFDEVGYVCETFRCELTPNLIPLLCTSFACKRPSSHAYSRMLGSILEFPISRVAIAGAPPFAEVGIVVERLEEDFDKGPNRFDVDCALRATDSPGSVAREVSDGRCGTALVD